MNLLTKRLPTILGLLMLVGIASGLWWYIGNNRPVITEAIQPAKVRITNVADSKFTVSWVTNEKTVGKVEYGMTGQKLTEKAMDERDQGTEGLYNTHHITVQGLQPNTQYAFRILSGENEARFENNGSPYSVTTGKVVGTTPVAESFYGQVQLPSGQAPEGAIVYLALPGATVASTLVKATGSYAIPVATIRTTDGSRYLTFDPKTTIASVSVESGGQTASATVPMLGVTPVPTITMGETHDFVATTPSEPTVSEVTPATPTVFNVEPLGSVPSANGELVILNPGQEGEQVATTLPEFRGLAPKGATLSITVHSAIPYSDTVTVANDGTWEWTPPEELSGGEHTITINYVDTNGIEQTIERVFSVATAQAAEGDPSFEATPSAGTYASPSPSPSMVATASPRVSNPATDSGVPVTGVTSYTLLTGAIGIVIVLLGFAMLAI